MFRKLHHATANVANVELRFLQIREGVIQALAQVIELAL
jgi:hypothetical protein